MKPKIVICPACKAELEGSDSVCPRCGQVVETFTTRIFPVVDKKKRIYPGMAYITRRRLVLLPGEDSSIMYMGFAGDVASAVGIKVKADHPELDSSWDQIADVHVIREKVGWALNSIAAGWGVQVTYSNGAQVVFAVNKDHAQRIADLMNSLRG